MSIDLRATSRSLTIDVEKAHKARNEVCIHYVSHVVRHNLTSAVKRKNDEKFHIRMIYSISSKACQRCYFQYFRCDVLSPL